MLASKYTRVPIFKLKQVNTREKKKRKFQLLKSENC